MTGMDSVALFLFKGVFLRHDVEDPKLLDATLATIKDLKMIEMAQSSTKFF